MKVPGSAILLLATGLFVQTSLANTDCSSEAQDLFERGRQADKNSRLEDARSLYTQAAQRCDRWEYWMAVGDIWVNDFLGDSIEAVNEEGRPAIDAYGKAFEAARRDSKKIEGAAAARALVELGLRAGDPLKANEWLLVARELDPSNPQLVELQNEVDFARDELSTGEIETGLSKTRGLGRVNSILMNANSGSAYWNSYRELAKSQGGGGDASPDIKTEIAKITDAGPSIDLPINFELNSTQATAQTALNIESLASALANRSGQETILFIGHADARGDAGYNMRLSRKRADLVRLEVEALQPALAGRISTDGRGELEPVATGNDERAHADNRRLEVIIRD